MKLKFEKKTKPNFIYKLHIRIISVILIVTLVLVQIYLSIQSISLGIKLSELESSLQKNSDKNQELRSNIVSLLSFSNLENVANNSGYIKNQKTIYIYGSDFVAKLP